ncbi:MAG: S9 family peptidase [Bacteroidota bacterium]
MKNIVKLFLAVGLVFAFFSCNRIDHQSSKKADKELDSLIAIGRLTPELLWKLGRIGEVSLSPDGKQVLYGLTYYDKKANKGNTNLWILPTSGGDPKQLTDFNGPESNGLWTPDGKKIAFLSSKGGSSQIWETAPDGTFMSQISKVDGDISGFQFSPDMKHVMYFMEVKMAFTPTEIYPDLPKANVRIEEDLMYRHWDSWFDYTYSHVFVAPYENGKIGKAIDIMQGELYDAPVKPDGGCEQIAWSPDGNKLCYTCKKQKGKEYALSTNSDIYLYDLNTKKTSNLSEGNPGYDMDPVFSPKGDMLVWKSMATAGYESDKDRIMIYNFATSSRTDYSANFDQSSASFQWSADGSSLYFISGINATYQVYSMSLADKTIKQITKGAHNYTALLVKNNTIIGAKMSMSMPTEIFKIDQASGVQTQLSFINKPILSKISMGKVEEKWVSTTDNKQMLVWVIYPPNFDAKKKYPALLYCQGGPQSAVSQFFSYRWNFQMMAANDYIVVAPNRRGLPTFGQAWNDQIAGDYGGQNMQDYLSAIDEISKQAYVDPARLGAVGASYGGYSVYWLAGHHQKRFKAFIAHCGMFNLESQFAETEEFFFVNHDLGGPYWQDPKPKSYDYSPHLFVKNWDTPIMIITGGKDFRIPYTESFQAFNAAQLKGIPSKLLFFPEESHFVLKPQNSILWQREFFGWLDKYLKPATVK